MREIYRGNGFVITTNDSGEIFVALEENPLSSLRISSNFREEMIQVSYLNTNIEMIPAGFKSVAFKI